MERLSTQHDILTSSKCQVNGQGTTSIEHDSPNAKERSTATGLSYELVIEVMNYVRNAEDKKCARLVCRQFAAAGLLSLREPVICMSHYKADLENLVAISNHPILSTQVKELLVYTPVLISGMDEETWTYYWLKYSVDALGSGKDDTPETRVEAGRQAQSLIRSQLDLNAEVEVALKRALVRMGNIREITFTSDPLSSNRMKRIPSLFCDILEPLIMDVQPHLDDSYALLPLSLRAASHSGLEIHALAEKVSERNGTRSTAGDIDLSGHIYKYFSTPPECARGHLQHVGSTITRIDLAITVSFEERPATALERGNIDLRDCLQHMPSLKQIILQHYIAEPDECRGEHLPDHDIDIGSALMDANQPSWAIKKLFLTGFRVQNHQALQAFLIAHTATLENVRLFNVHLTRLPWCSFIEVLRRAGVRATKQFDVHSMGGHSLVGRTCACKNQHIVAEGIHEYLWGALGPELLNFDPDTLGA